jgi:transmembrane sensor
MNEPDRINQSESRDEIDNRAADFLQRRRLLRWNSMDQAELDAWLSEATSHRVAFLRLEASVARVERAVELCPPRLDRSRGRPSIHLAIPFLATAASLGLIAALGFAAQRFLKSPLPEHTYSTEVGGRALLSFADNTQIELNTDTVVRYRMTTAERIVWLDRGEAWFRVTHDASRPFNVIVGNRRVTDLGTEFLVRSDPGRFEVALLKGRAQLSTGADRPQLASLTAGDEVVATSTSTSFTTKTSEQLADELGWQHGVLKLRNAKLSDAIRELNRYNQTKLVINDPVVAGTLIGGDFRTNSVDGFLQSAQLVLKLRVDRVGNTIILSRATDGSTVRAPNTKRETHSQ